MAKRKVKKVKEVKVTEIAPKILPPEKPDFIDLPGEMSANHDGDEAKILEKDKSATRSPENCASPNWEELRYGDDNTIHSSGYVDVEVDSEGKVVSVWFRCALVPFKQTSVDETRAREMRWTYRDAENGPNFMPAIKAIVFDKGIERRWKETESNVNKIVAPPKTFLQKLGDWWDGIS